MKLKLSVFVFLWLMTYIVGVPLFNYYTVVEKHCLSEDSKVYAHPIDMAKYVINNENNAISELLLNENSIAVAPFLIYHRSTFGSINNGAFHGCGQRGLFLWLFGISLPIYSSAWVS